MSHTLLIIGNKNYSSWSLRGWLALRKSGAVFEERMLLLDTPEFADDIADLSPTRRVPVLWHESRCIWDSYAIAEYANEVFAGGSMWPGDIASRAWARAICAEMHSGFSALRDAMPMNLRAQGRVVELSHAVQTDINRVFSIWQECRAEHAAAGPWLFGKFTIADAMYAPVALRFPTYGVELPVVAAQYLATIRSDPDVMQWISDGLAETEVVEPDEAGQQGGS